VLRDGAANYAATLADIATPEADKALEVDTKRCCLSCGLGCVSLTAIAAALVGIMAFVMSKLIPKLMAKMMPKMMGMMEEAGVRPPCAQIILEHLEETER
jgi:hypothetical protein